MRGSLGQCIAAEPRVCRPPSMLARHIVGGGAGNSKAALARCLIHSATTDGMLYSEVPLIHCLTRPRSHSSWSAKVAAVQPSTVMQLCNCVGSIAGADARRDRIEASYELFTLDCTRLTNLHAGRIPVRLLPRAAAPSTKGLAERNDFLKSLHPPRHVRPGPNTAIGQVFTPSQPTERAGTVREL